MTKGETKLVQKKKKVMDHRTIRTWTSNIINLQSNARLFNFFHSVLMLVVHNKVDNNFQTKYLVLAGMVEGIVFTYKCEELHVAP